MSGAAPRAVRLFTVAEFTTAEALLAAVRSVREHGHQDVDTYSPYPVHHGSEALGLKRSRVPLIALLGALAGVSIAYGFMYYMNAVDFPSTWGTGRRTRRPRSSPSRSSWAC